MKLKFKTMKSINKLYVLLALMLFGFYAVNGQSTLSIQSVTGASSGPVSVNVNATGLNDMVSFQFTITYDKTKLTYVNIANWHQGVPSTSVFINNNTDQGFISFVYFNTTPVSITNGVLFTINFTFTSGTAILGWSNTPTPLNIATSLGHFYNPSLTNGSVSDGGVPPLTYTISAVANPSIGGGITGARTYANGESCTLVAQANTGYSFVNWTEDGTQVSADASFTFAVSRNRALVANFIQNPINYTISTSSNPTSGGTTSGSGTYQSGQSRTVTATANSGYIFSNWTEGTNVVSTNASYTFTLTGNRNLVANFTQNPINYTITTSSNPISGGTTSGSGTYTSGQSRTVTAIANSGYTFSNWTEGANIVSTNSSFTFTLTGNRNLVANFTQNPINYTITTSSNPISGGTTSGSGTFQSGQSRTVTATANSGYIFSNWTDGANIVSTNSSFTFTLSSNRNLVANFNVNTQTNCMPEGLVAYYPFNGNANDESGNGKHGTIDGAILTTDRFGVSNKAYSFDGINDVINLPAGSNVQGSNPRTISAWFQFPDVLSSNGYCIYKGGANGNGNDFTLFINRIDATKYYLHLRRYFEDIVSEIITFEPNKWNHFAVMFDGTSNNGIKLYKDGQSLALSIQGNGSTFNTPSVTPQIGDFTDQFLNHYFAKGKIDDVCIFNRALSSIEIQSVFNNGLPSVAGIISGSTTVCQGQNAVTYTVPTIANATAYVWTLPSGASGTSTTNSISVNYGIEAVSGNLTVKGTNACGDGAISTLTITISSLPSNLFGGLLAYYPFNANANDKSGNSYHGELQGQSNFQNGVLGNALNFRGQSLGDYVSVQNSIDSLTQITIASWIYVNDFDLNCWFGIEAIISRGDPNASNFFGLSVLRNAEGLCGSAASLDNFGIRLNFSSSVLIDTEKSFIPNHWYHVTGTYDGVKLKIFVNNVLVKESEERPNLKLIGKSRLLINKHEFYSNGRMGGKIDELLLYKRALNPLEISSVYNNELISFAGSISGQESVCQGSSSVTYSIPTITNATSYVWTLPTGAIGTSTTNSINVNYGTSAVSGKITVKGKNSCGESAASTLNIVVNQKPNTPIITLTDNVLTSTASHGNQWYNQNGIVNGAVNQSYTATNTNNYYVIVSNLGCSSEPSNSIYVAFTGIEVIINNRPVKVYPNPVSKELIIEIEGNTEKINFEILNAIGQVIYKSSLIEKTQVNTSKFMPGFYILKLENGTTFERIKIVKE